MTVILLDNSDLPILFLTLLAPQITFNSYRRGMSLDGCHLLNKQRDKNAPVDVLPETNATCLLSELSLPNFKDEVIFFNVPKAVPKYYTTRSN